MAMYHALGLGKIRQAVAKSCLKFATICPFFCNAAEVDYQWYIDVFEHQQPNQVHRRVTCGMYHGSVSWN
jgi:hypothetical protein